MTIHSLYTTVNVSVMKPGMVYAHPNLSDASIQNLQPIPDLKPRNEVAWRKQYFVTIKKPKAGIANKMQGLPTNRIAHYRSAEIIFRRKFFI